MKKLLQVCGALALIAGLVVLAGCPNPSSSDSRDIGSVVGQISGVVYNSVTAQPIKDVVVELGTTSVKTDANGAYLFKDVEPGVYTVSFVKEGFQFRTKNVMVNAEEYKNKDPFLEKEILLKQLDILEEWVKSQAVVPEGGAASNWTYTNGIWIDGEGAAVKVTNESDKFVIEPLFLEANYSYGIPMYITGLAPLTGAITGKIDLFKTPRGDILKESISEAEPIPEGVEVWFEDTSSQIGWGANAAAQPEYNGTTSETANVKYGPGYTKADGTFEISGLPVGKALKLILNGFITDDGNYFSGKTIYTYSYVAAAELAFVAAPSTFMAENNEGKGFTNIGVFYLFTEGKFAVITANSTGTPVNPLNPTSEITVRFSEPIDPASFSAILQVTGNAVGGTSAMNLTTSWNTAGDTVTLAPADRNTGFLRISFPYSVNKSLPIGHLRISGKSKGGAEILATVLTAASSGVPVYTEEGLKIVSIDIAPVGYERIAISTKAVKITFSKEVNPATAEFRWGATWAAGRKAEFVADADRKSLTVLTDLMADGNGLFFNVSAAADANDIANGEDSGTGVTYTMIKAQPLTLVATNLYADKTGAVILSTGENANFTFTNQITLQFSRSLAGATVKAAVVDSTEKIATALTAPVTFDTILSTTTTSGDTATITMAKPLKPDTLHYLVFAVTKDNDVLFDGTTLNNYRLSTDDRIVAVTASSPYAVIFRTAPVELLLTETNLYRNRIGYPTSDVGTLGASANFLPANALGTGGPAITLDFNQDITNVVVKAFLSETVPTADKLDEDPENDPLLISLSWGISGKTLTITPKDPLKPDTQYYLALELFRNDVSIFSSTVLTSKYATLDSTILNKLLALGDNNGFKSLAFTTASENLVLLGTNIWNNKKPGIGTANFYDNTNFPLGGADVVLTFNKKIPAGSVIRAYLTDVPPTGGDEYVIPSGYDPSPLLKNAPTPDDKNLIIKLSDLSRPLEAETTYYLAVEIANKKDDIIFGNPADLATLTGVNIIDSTGIYFMFNVEDRIRLSSTSLYKNRKEGVSLLDVVDSYGTDANFLVNGGAGSEISITFNEPIPNMFDKSNIKVAFGFSDGSNAVPGNLGIYSQTISMTPAISTDRKTITITKPPLFLFDYDNYYYLLVEIQYGDRKVYFSTSDIETGDPEAGLVALATGGTPSKKFITFQAEKSPHSAVILIPNSSLTSVLFDKDTLTPLSNGTSESYPHSEFIRYEIDILGGSQLYLSTAAKPRPYYIEFDKDIIFTAPATGLYPINFTLEEEHPVLDGSGNPVLDINNEPVMEMVDVDYDEEIALKVSQVTGTNILQFEVVYIGDGAPANKYFDVELIDYIGATEDDEDEEDPADFGLLYDKESGIKYQIKFGTFDVHR